MHFSIGIDEIVLRFAREPLAPALVWAWGGLGLLVAKGRAPARYRFALQSHGNVIEATYEGLVPDTLVDGNEVFVEARLTREGLLEVVPDGIMAKSGNHLPSPGSCPRVLR